MDCYQAYYCGLCQSLARYGTAARMALSYDMTFAALLLSALYEPDTRFSAGRCVPHPLKTRPRAANEYLEYAGKTASEYGVTGYPTLFLLDPEGTIRFVKIGYSPLLAEELELAVRQILHDRPIQAQKNK